MAGGGALGRPETVKRGKKSKRKKKKRIGFHLDMTPLVDITFLLLTFFMFTTTMLKPQVMEMKIPPEIFKQVEVRASELMTILVRADNKLFYTLGLDEPQPLDIKKLAVIAYEQNIKPNVKNRLITVLKVAPGAKYATVINVLDELNIAEVPITEEISKDKDPETGEPVKRQRKFTIAEMTEEEILKIAGL